MKFSYALISMACLPSVIVHAAQDPNKSPKGATPLGVMEAQISELQKQLDDTFTDRQAYQPAMENDDPELSFAKREYARLDEECTRLEKEIQNQKQRRDAEIQRINADTGDEKDAELPEAEPPVRQVKGAIPSYRNQSRMARHEPQNDTLNLDETVKLDIFLPEKDDYCGRCLTVICPKAFYKMLVTCWGRANKLLACPFVLLAYGCCLGCMKVCDAGSEDPFIDFSKKEHEFSVWLERSRECMTNNCWKNLVKGGVNCAYGTFHYKGSKLVRCGPDFYNKIKGLCAKGLKRSIEEALDFKPGDAICCSRVSTKQDCKKTVKCCKCIFRPFGKILGYFACCCKGVIPEVVDLADIVVNVAAVGGAGFQ